MKAIHITILSLCAIGLSGCGTQGKINSEILRQPIPKNEARLIITRDNSARYFGAAADVSLDGRQIASLATKASIAKNISAGEHHVSVTTAGDAGSYSSKFNAKAGKTYNFEIGPNRNKSMLSTALFGVIGDSIAASTKENTGYFQITPSNGER